MSLSNLAFGYFPGMPPQGQISGTPCQSGFFHDDPARPRDIKNDPARETHAQG
jgi:hypothetical protein